MQINEIPICRMCFGRISNFLCTDCLNSDVERWLEIKNKNLTESFKNFSNHFTTHFSSDENKTYCVKCRSESDKGICLVCYANEISEWIGEQDRNLSEEFRKQTLNFEIKEQNKPYSGPVNYYPKNITIIGICEQCDNASDDLRKTDGSWVCEDCREI